MNFKILLGIFLVGTVLHAGDNFKETFEVKNVRTGLSRKVFVFGDIYTKIEDSLSNKTNLKQFFVVTDKANDSFYEKEKLYLKGESRVIAVPVLNEQLDYFPSDTYYPHVKFFYEGDKRPSYARNLHALLVEFKLFQYLYVEKKSNSNVQGPSLIEFDRDNGPMKKPSNNNSEGEAF